MKYPNKKQIAFLHLQGWRRNYFDSVSPLFFNNEKEFNIRFCTGEAIKPEIKNYTDMNMTPKDENIIIEAGDLIETLYKLQKTNWLRKLQFWK